MSKYFYRGREANGHEIVGNIEAADPDAVVKMLIERGITPIDITEEQATEKSALTMDIDWFGKKTVPITEVIMFSRQMFSLTKAGVPLIRAIAGLSETTTCEPLSNALSDVVTSLEAGQPLASAMQNHQYAFSPLYLSMIHVGENTGKLDEAFLQIASYLEADLQTKKRIQQAVRYPITVVIFVVLAIVVINILVIPKFADMFASFKAELPLPTRILIATSDFFVHQWKLLLFAVVFAFIAFFYWKSTPKGLLVWDQYRLKFPAVGQIIYQATLARFAKTFSMMLKAGVPLINSLSIVAMVVDNAYVGDRIRGMREGIERGESLTRNARESKMFSALILQMLVVGEESGAIDELLLEVADYYEREVEYKVKKLSDAIEPVLIICVGVMVLVLALGVFLPLWELSNVQS